jgi:hypothetical protein
MAGVVSFTPFLITIKAPFCCATKILPSGANASTVGLEIPVATDTWLKLAGKVCACNTLAPDASKAISITLHEKNTETKSNFFIGIMNLVIGYFGSAGIRRRKEDRCIISLLLYKSRELLIRRPNRPAYRSRLKSFSIFSNDKLKCDC